MRRGRKGERAKGELLHLIEAGAGQAGRGIPCVKLQRGQAGWFGEGLGGDGVGVGVAVGEAVGDGIAGGTVTTYVLNRSPPGLLTVRVIVNVFWVPYV